MAEVKDIDVTLLFASEISDMMLDNEISEKLFDLRYSALLSLWKQLLTLQEEGFRKDLLYAIAEKKVAMIRTITSRTEMAKLMNAKAPHYDGSKFIPGAYYIPEEELIGWSKASQLAPLNPVGVARYCEVFQQVLPEEAAQISEKTRN